MHYRLGVGNFSACACTCKYLRGFFCISLSLLHLDFQVFASTPFSGRASRLYRQQCAFEIVMAMKRTIDFHLNDQRKKANLFRAVKNDVNKSFRHRYKLQQAHAHDTRIRIIKLGLIFDALLIFVFCGVLESWSCSNDFVSFCFHQPLYFGLSSNLQLIQVTLIH